MSERHEKVSVMAAASPILQRLEIVNDCPCVALRDEEQAIAVLNDLVVSGRGGYSVAINAEKIVFYGSRSDVRALINKASLPYADGAGAVLSMRWLHGKKASKINMPMACIAGRPLHPVLLQQRHRQSARYHGRAALPDLRRRVRAAPEAERGRPNERL